MCIKIKHLVNLSRNSTLWFCPKATLTYYYTDKAINIHVTPTSGVAKGQEVTWLPSDDYYTSHVLKVSAIILT